MRHLDLVGAAGELVRGEGPGAIAHRPHGGAQALGRPVGGAAELVLEGAGQGDERVGGIGPHPVAAGVVDEGDLPARGGVAHVVPATHAVPEIMTRAEDRRLTN